MTASVVVHLRYIKTSGQAALFQDADGICHWLPLSQIDLTGWNPEDVDDLEVPKWLADKKDLAYDED